MTSEPGFRVGWRGYHRLQVGTYRSPVETELVSAAAPRTRVRARAQSTEQLRAAQAELGRFRGRLTDGPTALSERLREILRLAGRRPTRPGPTRRPKPTAPLPPRSDAEMILQRPATRPPASSTAPARTAETAGRHGKAQAAARRQLDHRRAEAVRLRDTARTDYASSPPDAQQARDRADTEAAPRRSDADRARP